MSDIDKWPTADAAVSPLCCCQPQVVVIVAVNVNDSRGGSLVSVCVVFRWPFDRNACRSDANGSIWKYRINDWLVIQIERALQEIGGGNRVVHRTREASSSSFVDIHLMIIFHATNSL